MPISSQRDEKGQPTLKSGQTGLDSSKRADPKGRKTSLVHRPLIGPGYPAGWHPPMAPLPSLKISMNPVDLQKFLRRELKAYRLNDVLPYGHTRRLVDSDIKDDESTSWETASSSDSTASITPRRRWEQASRSQRDVQPYQGRRPIGMAWWFHPFPLSKKEERMIGRRSRWQNLPLTHFGDYFVAPARYDLKWIQRIFWAAREIRSALRTISLSPSKFFIKDLMEIRNQINSLSPGNGKSSRLQCKLNSDVYFCLRQCNRL